MINVPHHLRKTDAVGICVCHAEHKSCDLVDRYNFTWKYQCEIWVHKILLQSKILFFLIIGISTQRRKWDKGTPSWNFTSVFAPVSFFIMGSSKNLLPAWSYAEEKVYPTTCILASCTIGIGFLAIGSVLTAIFRKIPMAADIAMSGVAFIVLGVVLIVMSSCLSIGLLLIRQRHPKTSSAAKAEVPPDPFSLVPVYPSHPYPLYNDFATSSQILLLPGGVDPISATFGT